ncbi:MAG: hypothetical protein AB7H77_09545 [Bdellovibrionales bacterium]
MPNPHYRYFIELQPRSDVRLPRAAETEGRRETARGFVETMRGWLKEKNLGEKVSALNITLFGQIQITCEASVIRLIRDEEAAAIAAIRQGALCRGIPARWNEAR